jgi:hypothetical protein
MGSIFSPKMPSSTARSTFASLHPLLKCLPEEKKKIAAEQAEIERKRKGRQSTILTGPLGDLTEAELEKKTLLGS